MANISGIQQLESNVKSMVDRVRKASLDAVTVGGYRIDRTAKQLLSEAGTGRSYTRINSSGARIIHIASVPGQPPANDRGGLTQSLYVTPIETFDGAFCIVGTTLVYGGQLEFGTSKIAARPWLSVALNNNRLANIMTFKSLMRKAVTEGVQS